MNEESYFRVSDLWKLCDDSRDWGVPTFTADELREHGHWSPNPYNKEWDVCSACRIGTKIREYGLNPDGNEYVTEYTYKYCPNCGAKMDEVVK